jgi:glucose-6-phosphate isomerase
MLGWNGELPEPAVRTFDEMRSVLAEPSFSFSEPIYLMYRDLARSETDWAWLRHHHLRYDLTVIPPLDMGGEWAKTKGHYHSKNPAGVGYPEIYEVLEGQAHYLLQSRALDDAVMISASAGDLVIIPPDYGHVTINPSRTATLVMANIVSTAFESEYREYERCHGGAFYEMTSGELRRNLHYDITPPIRYLGPSCGRGTHRVCKGPIYDMIGNEEALRFLNFPEQYRPVFAVILKG